MNRVVIRKEDVELIVSGIGMCVGEGHLTLTS